jgi:hypothetical protein
METTVEKVWIDDRAVYIRTKGGEVFCERFQDYPRLRYATAEQRAAFEYNNIGIRWDELDEDLCFEGFMREEKQAKAALCIFQ